MRALSYKQAGLDSGILSSNHGGMLQTVGNAMNNLEMVGWYGFVALCLGVAAVRKWPHAPRPRALLGMWIAYCASLLAISSAMFVHLTMDPTYIRPAEDAFPGPFVWATYTLVALWLLALLISLARTGRTLLHRLAHQR
jgi:hypothetical protein